MHKWYVAIPHSNSKTRKEKKETWKRRKKNNIASLQEVNEETGESCQWEQNWSANKCSKTKTVDEVIGKLKAHLARHGIPDQLVSDSKSIRGNPRPILARFLRYQDHETVLCAGFELKDTEYTILQDSPQETIKRRRKQMPKLKEAKKRDQKISFSRPEPDKLFIDGKFVSK